MNYEILDRDGKRVLRCLEDGGVVSGEPDALDLVAACGENQCRAILLHESNFHEDFFNLKSGLAGAILLKFVNYRISAAAILPLDRWRTGRFGEMVSESNRGRDFRVFEDGQAAQDWLFSLD